MTKTLSLINPLRSDEHPAIVYIAGLVSPSSRRSMRSALGVVTRLLGEVDPLRVNWSAIRFQHAAALRARLIEGYAPSTCNKLLSALRGVVTAAYHLEQIDPESFRRVLAALKGVEGEHLPAGRELLPGELRSLVEVCKADLTPAGVRDAAILAVLYAGLRRAEVSTLELGHWFPGDSRLVVHGKGRKERAAYLPPGGHRALEAWVNLRGFTDGALFTRIGKGGVLTLAPISSQAVYVILQRRAESAGVENITPHDLRRTFVSNLLEAGADTVIVSKLVGHADPKTTARYDRRPEDEKRRVVTRLDFPF
ncbi:MAG: site-specific integrase [Anaerolineae bacterium]|nr:site-specific integrase [Anaerolineae bacterium]